MEIRQFAGDPAEISWPGEYVAELEALSPVEQLRYFYKGPTTIGGTGSAQTTATAGGVTRFATTTFTSRRSSCSTAR